MRREYVAAVAAATLFLGGVVGLAVINEPDDLAAPPRRPSTTSSSTSTTESTTTTTIPATTVAPPAPPGSARPPATPRPTAAPRVCPPVPERVKPLDDRPRYTLRVNVVPAENKVDGDLAVRFTPDRATDRLVFRLWPNGPRLAQAGANLATGPVRIGGTERPSRLDAPTILVVDSGPLEPGRTVEITMPWHLTLPGSNNDRISRHGESIRLGSFFPILAWEPGAGWAVDPATTAFAESSMNAGADFTASVTVPDGLMVLATGVRGGDGRFVAENVPDFALSVGRFTLASRTIHVPNRIDITVGVHAGMSDNPTTYLNKVADAFTKFSSWFGTYPWPSYTLALTPNLSGGIEYPMHVMQGPNTNARTTSHEVGHQWFHSMVGSNQGRDPWLDEGLASYAEFRYEGTLATAQRRTIPSGGKGYVGEPMTYWESRQAIYYRSVYVQGAQAVAALGPPDLVDCGLRHYVARFAFRVADQRDIADALSAVFPDARAVLARFGAKV